MCGGRVPVGGTTEVTIPGTKAGCDLVSGLRVGGPCRGSVLEQLSCVGTGVTVASAFRAGC